ncbi:MAG: MAE_28990/MAE_18760 family HEPN-like nuclease [Gammaproteobacteria bacterium]
MSAEEYESLLKTLKANGFILLYNLVESTMKNAIEGVFEEFRAVDVSFDDCREEVRRIVLANLKAHNPDRVFSGLTPIAKRVLTETFRKEKAFAGNVDAKKIREVAKDYGFKEPRSKGDNLLTVKSQRNDLAHGDKAFGEVGRDFDVERLMKIKTEVVTYLEEVLQNVSDYLSTQEYLASVATANQPSHPAVQN